MTPEQNAAVEQSKGPPNGATHRCGGAYYRFNFERKQWEVYKTTPGEWSRSLLNGRPNPDIGLTPIPEPFMAPEEAAYWYGDPTEAEDEEWQRKMDEQERRNDPEKHYGRHYKGIKLDPYRIARVYEMQGGPREQIMKKCLRFTDKGQSEREVVNEIKSALARWEQMLDEDGL